MLDGAVALAFILHDIKPTQIPKCFLPSEVFV